MELKYSRKEFDGYTHRFIVKFNIGDEYPSNIDIYSNSDSFSDLDKFIEDKKSKNVLSFEIIHRASKEQDEACRELIEESLENL